MYGDGLSRWLGESRERRFLRMYIEAGAQRSIHSVV